jgi:hypothetical protein
MAEGDDRMPAVLLLAMLCAPLARFVSPQGEALPGDGRSGFLAKIDRDIAAHRFLRTVKRVRLEDWAPAVIDVQLPADAPADYAAKIGAELGPWIQALESAFARDYAGPLELPVDPGRASPYVLVLATRGDWVNFADLRPPRLLFDSRGACDPQTGMVVTYRDPATGPWPYREAVLTYCARMLLERSRAASQREGSTLWIESGFPYFLSFTQGPEPDSLEKHPADIRALAYLDRYARDPALRAGYLHPLRELVAFADSTAVQKAVQRKAPAVGLAVEPELVSYLFFAEANLFVHFLHRGMDGKWRESLPRLLDGALADQPGASVAAEVFGPHGLDEIEPAFFAFVQRELASATGTRPEVSLPDGAPIDPPESAPVMAAPAAPVVPEAPKWTPAELVLQPSESDAWLARAVHHGLRGEIVAAIAELDVLAAQGLAPETGKRVAAEKQRLSLLRDLRKTVLAELQRSGKPLKVELAGQRLSAKIVAVDGELVRLEPGRTGIAELHEAEIPPSAVIALASKEALAAAGGWIAAWPACVEGDPKWKRDLVKDKSPEAVALRADAEGGYPAMLGVAQAALELEKLAALAEVSEVSQATTVQEAVRSLWQDHRDVECVSSRATALRGLAERAFGLLAKGYDPVEHLHASKLEHFDDGRVRIAYGFDDAAELEDFHEDASYQKERQALLAPLALSPAETSRLVEGSALLANGKRLLLHVLDFEAPMRLSWSFSFSYVQGKPSQECNFYVGMCADSKGVDICGDHVGWMYLETLTNQATVAGPTRELYMDRAYQMELRHDGSKAEYWKDGVLQGSAPAAAWKGGNVFLCLNSDMLLTLTDFTIEGRISVASITRARERWVADQVASLGIDAR